VPASSLGEFSLEPQQGEVLAVFVPLARLQAEMEVSSRVNTVLVAAHQAVRSDAVMRLTPMVRSQATLDDVGLRVRSAQNDTALIVESESAVVDDRQAAVIDRVLMASGLQPHRIFTYLANSIRDGDREIPYSLVSALDFFALPAVAAFPAAPAPPVLPIVLNRIALIEDLAPDAMDQVNSDAFAEAYKDLTNIAEKLLD